MYVCIRTHCRVFDEDYSGFVPEGDLRPLGVEDSTTGLGGAIVAKMRIVMLVSGRLGGNGQATHKAKALFSCALLSLMNSKSSYILTIFAATCKHEICLGNPS